jgi:hypothetical protein
MLRAQRTKANHPATAEGLSGVMAALFAGAARQTLW